MSGIIPAIRLYEVLVGRSVIIPRYFLAPLVAPADARMACSRPTIYAHGRGARDERDNRGDEAREQLAPRAR